MVSEFGKVLIFCITGVIILMALFGINRLIARPKFNKEKMSSYECGEEATGGSWFPISNRFYVIALIFLLFDVEIIFIFPWATVLGDAKLLQQDARWGWYNILDMFVFISLLLLGLAYVWKRGNLKWLLPTQTLNNNINSTKAAHYQRLNNERHIIQKFSVQEEIATVQEERTENTPPPTAPNNIAPQETKAAYKPMFRKKL